MAKDKILKPFVGIIAPENKFTVDTIDDLKNKNYLTISDIVDILGYYSKGDRGAHKRIIESTSKVGGIQLANGLWANVLPVAGEVWAEWFGLKPEIEDCSPIFNTAAEFVYSPTGKKDGKIIPGSLKMKCHGGSYRCLNTIFVSNRRESDFNGASLSFADSQDNIGLVVTGRFYPEETDWQVSRGVTSIKNVEVLGLDSHFNGYFTSDTPFHEKNFMYKEGFTGVEFRGGSDTYNVRSRACEKGLVWNSRDTFLQTTTSPYVNFCKYGIVLALDGVANSNENIKFSGGAIGNNWSAFYGKVTGAFFYNCSIDYNWFLTDPYNPWNTGASGTPSGILSFDQCWFEDTRSDVDVYFSTTQSQVRFDNCYLILPKKKFFLKAEGPNDLITFSDCLFGDSGDIATEGTRLIMRGTTYHKLWSQKGAGKFRKADNLIFNGYMQEGEKTEATTLDGNLIKGWKMKQKDNVPGQTFSTLEYFTDEDGVLKLKMKNGKFRGCQLWTTLFAVRAGEFITMKAVSDAEYCEIHYYDGEKELISKNYIAPVNGVRLLKLQAVPAGVCYGEIVFANPYYDASGTDEMVVEYCEVNVVN